MTTSAGLLGAYALERNIAQSIYACARTQDTIVTVNITNRSGATARVSIAITTTRHVSAAAEYIQFQMPLTGKTSYERQAIFIPAGKFLTIISDIAGVSAQCWGIERGDVDLLGPSVNTNLGLPPSYAEATTSQIAYSADALTNLDFTAVDPQGLPVTYAVTTGTLPTGLTLSAAGRVSGTASPAGYTPGKADVTTAVTVEATNSNALSTPQAFNIVQKWHDGTSQALAATSAQAIYDMSASFQGAGASAWFWIKGVGTSTAQARRMYCSMNGGGYMLWFHYRDPISGSLSITDPGTSGTTFNLTDNNSMFMYAVPQAIVDASTYLYLNSNNDTTPTTPAFANFKYAVGLNTELRTWATSTKDYANLWGVRHLAANTVGRQRSTVNYRYGTAIGEIQYGHNHGGGFEFESFNFRNTEGAGGRFWTSTSEIWTYSGWGAIDASAPGNVNTGWGSTGLDEAGWGGADRQNHLYAWLK